MFVSGVGQALVGHSLPALRNGYLQLYGTDKGALNNRELQAVWLPHYTHCTYCLGFIAQLPVIRRSRLLLALLRFAAKTCGWYSSDAKLAKHQKTTCRHCAC